MPPRLWIPIAALIAVGGLFVLLWWSSPSRQARQWCLRTQAALAAGDAAALMAEIHPTYDAVRHWPDLGDGGLLALAAGDTTGRERFQRILAIGLAARRERGPLVLTLNLRQSMPQEDGRVVVHVDVAMTGGPSIEPVKNVRFVLGRAGWSPRLSLIDHEDVTLLP